MSLQCIMCLKFFQWMSISNCLLWASKRMFFSAKNFMGPITTLSLQPEGKCRIELQNYCDAITTYYHLSTSILVVMFSGLWCLLQLLTIFVKDDSTWLIAVQAELLVFVKEMNFFLFMSAVYTRRLHALRWFCKQKEGTICFTRQRPDTVYTCLVCLHSMQFLTGTIFYQHSCHLWSNFSIWKCYYHSCFQLFKAF